MIKEEILMLKRDDPGYPPKMKELTGMPQTLYALGELPDPLKPSVGIVGARMCSAYGRKTAYEFGKILAENGVQVISGMAAGIDGSAQEGALDGGGKSFAVLGSGVDVCYPRGNTTLYNRLKHAGGILSEHPAGTAPLPYHFPSRNRIISALSDIVLVVEAKSESGSLITVDFALAQGRTVFAVPGRVGDALSDGCNWLIAQGAGIAYAPEAVLSELLIGRGTSAYFESRIKKARLRHLSEKRVKHAASLSEEARKVYEALSFEDPVYPDAIALKTLIDISAVRASLQELAGAGFVEEPERDSFLRRCPDTEEP